MNASSMAARMAAAAMVAAGFGRVASAADQASLVPTPRSMARL